MNNKNYFVEAYEGIKELEKEVVFGSNESVRLYELKKRLAEELRKRYLITNDKEIKQLLVKISLELVDYCNKMAGNLITEVEVNMADIEKKMERLEEKFLVFNN